MEIVRKDSAINCKFNELSNGDVFRLCVQSSAIFIKTDSIKTKGDALYNALRADNGKHIFVDVEEKIIPLNAKLVIMPLSMEVDE